MTIKSTYFYIQLREDGVDDGSSLKSDSSRSTLSSQSSISSIRPTSEKEKHNIVQRHLLEAAEDRRDIDESSDEGDDKHENSTNCLASKLTKLHEEFNRKNDDNYLAEEATKNDYPKAYKPTKPRSMEVQHSPAPHRRMSLATIMHAANNTHRLNKTRTPVNAHFNSKKDNGTKYTYYNGMLTRLQDIPAHLRDLVPKVSPCSRIHAFLLVKIFSPLSSS